MASALADVLLRANAPLGPVSDNPGPMVQPPYDPTGYPRAAWAGAKAAGNALVWEPGQSLGETLKRIADGQGGFTDYADAGMNIAGAIPGGLLAKLPAMAAAIPLARGALQNAGRIGNEAAAMRPKFNEGNFLIYTREDPALHPRAQPQFKLGEDGALEAVIPKGWNPGPHSFAYRDPVFRFLDKEMAPKYDHFWRFTDNKAEPGLLESRMLRPSFNYADNVPEKGLSVAEGAHYGAQPYKYGYGVRGDVIAHGSDGEPILDLSSVNAATPIMSKSTILTRDARLARDSAAERGWEPGDMKRFLDSLLEFK